MTMNNQQISPLQATPSAQTFEQTLVTAEQTPNSWLDRSVGTLVRVNWETVAWAILLIVAAVARFYDLGARAMSHDESLHSLYAYYLYDAGNYEHNPMMHGPFRFHITALVYFLFGDSDTTARLAPALMGMGVLWVVYFYRRYIGRVGAFLAGVMVAISPSLLFHSRYIRDDIFMSFYTVVWVFAIARYLDVQTERRFRWVWGMVLAMAFAFITMENAFIHGAILGAFCGALALWQIIQGRMFMAITPTLFAAALAFWMLESGQQPLWIAVIVGAGVIGTFALLFVWTGAEGWRKLRRNEVFDLAVLMLTLIMPFLAPFGHYLFQWDPMAYTTTVDMLRSAGLVTLMTAASVGLAYFWFGRRGERTTETGVPLLSFGQWAQFMGVFWVVQVLFFTTFLTNTRNGLATGIIGSLGYWLAQQEVQRGNQPGYYYLMLASLYEFLPLLLTLGGFGSALYWLLRQAKWEPVHAGDLPNSVLAAQSGQAAGQAAGEAELLRRNRVYFVVLTLWWTVGMWLGYTAAGERMPWLLTHIALPMCVVGGWWLGQVITRVPWRQVRANGAIWLLAAPLVVIFALVLFFSNAPFSGRSVTDLSSTTQWIVALVLLGGLVYGIWKIVQGNARATVWRLLAAGMAGVLLLLTVRVSFMLNYVNYDLATEYLVYAHASPDVKRALAEIDLISERTVGGRNIVVAYDDDTSWPLSWYMRLYPNARFYGDNPTSDVMSAPVVIVGTKNYEKVRPYMARDYVKRTYRLVWWPDQGYFDLTWQRFWDTITDPAKMEDIFQIVFYRRYPDAENPDKYRDLTEWPNRHEFEMYVRKDLAAQIWDLNVMPIAQTVDPQEALIQARTLDVAPVGTIAGEMGATPLLTPRAIAVAGNGNRIIADSGNHRIVITDPNGTFIQAFGGLCRMGEGEAGGCVDADGTGPLELGDGQFNEPWGVAVDSQGQIYVADTWNGRIQVFDSVGNFLRKWGYFNTTNGTLGDPLALFGPRGIAVDGSDNLIVADTGNKRVLQFTPNGELLNQVGGGGVLLGNFEEPTDVAVDPTDGSIYVADAWNRRIQKLDANLQPLAEWPVPSWGSQHLYYKPYIAAAGNGDVYISDPENFRILVYNSAGGLKSAFGSFGVEANRFALPNGVAWDAQNNQVLVADADNQRVQVFAAVP